MSKDTELLSWPDEAGEPSGALGEALALARKDDVSAAQVARLAATLAPLYGLSIVSAAQASSAVNAAASASASSSAASAGAGASAAAGAAAGAAGGTASIKVITAVLAIGALGTAGLMSMRAPSSAPPTVQHGASAEVARLAPAQAVPLPSAEPPRAPQANRPASEAAAPGPVGVARAADAAPAGTKRRSHENAPVEAQLLTEAHRALASDAARALRLADEHRARFPRGALAAERELLAVRALERLDLHEQAQKRIARARRELPSSAPVQRAAERLGAVK
jgi:hypothetical protein